MVRAVTSLLHLRCTVYTFLLLKLVIVVHSFVLCHLCNCAVVKSSSLATAFPYFFCMPVCVCFPFCCSLFRYVCFCMFYFMHTIPTFFDVHFSTARLFFLCRAFALVWTRVTVNAMYLFSLTNDFTSWRAREHLVIYINLLFVHVYARLCLCSRKRVL